MQRINVHNKIFLFLLMMTIVFLSSCDKKMGTLDEEIIDAKTMVLNINESLSTEGTGGVWAVVGLVRGGFENDEKSKDLLESYKVDLVSHLKKHSGEIDEDYYSSYSRNIIGAKYVNLSSTNIEGFNILKKLDQEEQINKQGVTSTAFALIASNVSGKNLNSEELYIKTIIEDINRKKQFENNDSTDYATMSIQGLSYYYEREDVKKEVDKWLNGLSKLQKEDGSMGNCESTCELIIALTSIGIDPREDDRFIKKENTLLDGLHTYKRDKGYIHVIDEDAEYNHMSTEKAFLALVSLKLMEKKEKLFQ